MKRALSFYSRAVWPPASLLALFVAVYGICEGAFWLLELLDPYPVGNLSDLPEFMNFRASTLGGILGAAAGLHALVRLWRFHPACHRAYADWLKSSPWTADKPLPLGPIHPVWQDAMVIGVLTAIAAWHAQANPALPVKIFGLAYLGGMTFLLANIRGWSSCVVLGFLWPALLVLPGVEGVSAMVIIAAMIVVVWYEHRKSLRAFPWENLIKATRPDDSILQMELRIGGLSGTPATGSGTNVGWPFQVLSPKAEYRGISTLNSFLLSLLIGWWSFCFIKRLDAEPHPELILFFALIAAACRLTIYCPRLAPSFNLWGRITSGKIIVPGFDKVLLTPLAAVLLAIIGGMIIRRSGSWYPVVESGVIGLILYVLLSGGPRLRNWTLTGRHRFRSPVRNSAYTRKLQSI